MIALALATFIHLSSDSYADPPLPLPFINNPGPQNLHYILDLATDGERPRFLVDLYFQGNADGASKLRLTNGWDTQKQIYKSISNGVYSSCYLVSFARERADGGCVIEDLSGDIQVRIEYPSGTKTVFVGLKGMVDKLDDL